MCVHTGAHVHAHAWIKVQTYVLCIQGVSHVYNSQSAMFRE